MAARDGLMTDPRSRRAAVGDRFPVGVNYWPRRKAMGWWKAFDPSEVADELDVIADIGLTIVRIFMLWEDVQPTPDRVSEPVLRDLETVADLAAERGLGLDVTFFTGHMSGPNWAPPWLLGGDRPVPGGRQVVSGANEDAGPYRDLFTDPQAVTAGRLLAGTVAKRMSGHPALWAWNLGNEPDLFSLPPDSEAAPRWARAMVEAIRTHDDRTPVTIGLHLDSLLADNGLRVDRMFRDCDLGVMHAYPLYVDLATGPTDPDLVPFAVALTASLAGMPVLAEELGGCTVRPGQPTQPWEWEALGRTWSQLMLSEEDLAAYVEAVLPRLVEVGALGALLWCFADYHPDLWTSPPCDTKLHERHFGLVRPDGSLKPHAEVVRRFVASDPRVMEAPARARIGIGGDAFYADPRGNLPGLYETFRRRG
jgi:endo-1,4-beta-mannosidase